MNQPVILHFFLLFGQSPRLSIHAIFDLQPEAGARSHVEYVTKWKNAKQEAYSLALKSAMKSAIRGKRNYDIRVTSSALQVGDRVLVRNLTPCGRPGKLRAFWEDEIQVQSASKKAAGVETNAPIVDSDEVSGQMEASSPDEVPTTESPQAIGGETSMEQDSSNQGRPRRVRQGPKWLK